MDAKQVEALEETMALLLVVAIQNSVDKEKSGQDDDETTIFVDSYNKFYSVY